MAEHYDWAKHVRFHGKEPRPGWWWDGFIGPQPRTHYHGGPFPNKAEAEDEAQRMRALAPTYFEIKEDGTSQRG
jgi:hypothetical protein